MARVESQSEEVVMLSQREDLRKVRRGQQEVYLRLGDIRQGDIVLFEKGDFIEVDGMLLEVERPSLK